MPHSLAPPQASWPPDAAEHKEFLGLLRSLRSDVGELRKARAEVRSEAAKLGNILQAFCIFFAGSF